MWGKLGEMFVIVTSLSQQDDNTDILLNQLIQFYSNNATNLHLTSHSRPILRVVPEHGDRIMTTNYCDVTSPDV